MFQMSWAQGRGRHCSQTTKGLHQVDMQASISFLDWKKNNADILMTGRLLLLNIAQVTVIQSMRIVSQYNPKATCTFV